MASRVSGVDWHAWHDDYDRPDSVLAARLRVVQERIREVFDTAPPGPLRVVSLCAGQGRDLLGALAEHPRAGDVTARLVEIDPRNADAARSASRAAGLTLEVVTGDAALTDHYLDLVPAHVVLMCGVFGNLPDVEVEAVVDDCTALCANGGAVVWTRHRRAPDLVPQICTWFERRGFQRLWLSDPAHRFGVGVHRFTGTPRPLPAGRRMFTFHADDSLWTT